MIDTLTSFDLLASLSVNRFVGRMPTLDALLHIVERNSVFKGAFSMMLFWGLWFAAHRDRAHVRARLLATLLVAVLAVFVGRALAVTLPYRPRPIHDPELGFLLHDGLTSQTLDGWSSMPSDHAVLYFALATGMFLAHRVVGAVALAHAIFIICLPRIYFGLHFTLDIAVGAAIGVAMSLVLVPALGRLFERRAVADLALSHGGLFYPLVFFTTWQVALMFGPVRDLLRDLAAALT